MQKPLVLSKVMKSETHWADPSLVNPCTERFVEDCITRFPAGSRTTSGVGDTYAHFHSWVNEQTRHAFNIPGELTRQMWDLKEQRRPRAVWAPDYYPV